MHITLVKKILADGSPCRKCAEVEERLQTGGFGELIDHIAIADERDPDSEGMQLARKHDVKLAPFFIVEKDNGSVEIHTIYFRLVKEVLQPCLASQDKVA